MRLAICFSAVFASKFRTPEFATVYAAQVEKLGQTLVQPSRKQYDVVIIGGGIVGAATAREIALKYPKLKLALVEKEDALAKHQSGHNSGVIHAGIYYKPGSLRAKLCVQGLELTYKYCDENKIPYKKCGKLIVAVEERELPVLDDLYSRGVTNGVKGLKVLTGDEIKQVEPNCTGLKAIWSPNTGIVDWGQVNRSFGEDFAKSGGDIYFNFETTEFKLDEERPDTVKIVSKTGTTLSTRFVITAAGLHSDRIARLTGCNPNPRIVPFRGEYLVLKPEKSNLVKGNIYPVPDTRFPFLGVHFTPRMDGSVWLGPNAVLAFKREGYNFTDFSFKDAVESLSFKGLRKLVFKYFTPGLSEMYRSFNMRAQVELLRRYVPNLTADDVMRGPTGVRAQALNEDGSLVEDFVFDSGEGQLGKLVLHVRNAPSPAATSSLAIAKTVVGEVERKFLLNK